MNPVAGPTHWSPALHPPGESTTPVQEQTRADVVQLMADPVVFVTCGLQLPPVGVGTVPPPMVNDPPDPHEPPSTSAQAAVGVTVAHVACWHAWSGWNVPLAEHVCPDGLQVQLHVSALPPVSPPDRSVD